MYWSGVHPKFPGGGKMTQYLAAMKVGMCQLYKQGVVLYRIWFYSIRTPWYDQQAAIRPIDQLAEYGITMIATICHSTQGNRPLARYFAGGIEHLLQSSCLRRVHNAVVSVAATLIVYVLKRLTQTIELKRASTDWKHRRSIRCFFLPCRRVIR